MENVTLIGIFISIFTVIISLLYKYISNRRKLLYENSSINNGKHSSVTSETTGSKNSWPTDGTLTSKESAEEGYEDEPTNNVDTNIDSNLDPVEFCNHIQREIKKTQHKAALKKIESTMTREQMEEERAIQRKQLQDIFNMMVQQEEFGVQSVDDIQEQMKLYV